MFRSIVFSVTVVAAAACYHGPSITKFEPAYTPDGIEASLRLAHARVEGELLAVQDSAFIVLSDSQRVVMIPVSKVTRGDFGDLGVLIDEFTPSQQTLERLRLLSRFPSGLTPDLRTRLLALYRQTEIEVVQ